MACRVRYLNSAGIMLREIKGIEALSKAFPAQWLLYVSLACYPRNQDPMELDAVVVMDDMVLLLEIKDWNGKLSSRRDCWYLGGQFRGRSPVNLGEEKAKKLKSVIASESKLAGSFYVDSRVVLTGTATREALPPHEIARTLTLSEACAIGDPLQRTKYVRKGRISLAKAHDLEGEFDRIFNNTLLFQPSEADWAGFTVTQKDVFLHPKGVWSDHIAERKDEQRIKAMVRRWSFDRLPVALNTMATRKLVALRETHAFAYLQDIGSELTSRNRMLRDIGSPENEVTTNHFEVRSIGNGWNTLDRYLVQRGDDLTWQDRIVITSSLLSVMSELHRHNVAHRDIGPKAVWIGSPSDIGLTGFMSCQLPDKVSVMDWLTDLRGYATELPEDAHGGRSTGRQRDVYGCSHLAAMILSGVEPREGDVEPAISALPQELKSLSAWLRKGLSQEPSHRFDDAIELTSAFSDVVEDRRPEGFEAALLDRFETETIPFLSWIPSGLPVSQGVKQLYPSTREGRVMMVKVWTGMIRGLSLSSDLALLRLMEGADRLRGAPVVGLPTFVEIGLSRTGAYVVYERCPGAPLESIIALPEEHSILLVAQLLSAVEALHGLDCTHGDISPSNIVIDVEAKSICLIDAFDISPLGDGSVRTPAMCPPNWERLSPVALDRYAALKAASHLFQIDPSPVAERVQKAVSIELERPVVESLEPISSLLKEILAATNSPPIKEFVLQTGKDAYGFGLGDRIFVRRALNDQGESFFRLTTVTGQLTITGVGDRVIHNFRKTQFTSLAHESRAGYDNLPLKILLKQGAESGFLELYRFLSEQQCFIQAAGGGKTDNGTPASSFDVMRYWSKLIELEQDARVEIGIREILSSRESVVVCSFENLGKNFDFDDEDVIEVFAGTRKIGRVDQLLSSFPDAIGIQCDYGHVSIGDRLRLSGRREQTSLDRRTRAVRRILEGRSTIPELIDYFGPDGNRPATSYDVRVEDDDLKCYELNVGQEAAFRRLLASGPVGLLQGPPGTGKTRFIASFVHWLLTKGGSQRILIASQSHEAVNNAVDSLLLLHKRRGDRPSLLRIGSKGITARIRPFHSVELRERYRVRFEAAAKHRFGQLATALGVNREFASALFDLDKEVGVLARRCASVQIALADYSDQLATDRERNRVQQGRVEDAYAAAFLAYAGVPRDGGDPISNYEELVQSLIKRYPSVSPSDATAARRSLQLTQDWLSSLGSPGRNFEEFLAKTRSVVAATCVGVGETRIRIDAQPFDWVIVDEAARCTPGELAVPVQMARRVLLVGDHLQLRPMLGRELLDDLQESHPDCTRAQLSMSDFERAFTSPYGRNLGERFTEQYRMDEAICSMVSACFYEPNNITLETSPARVATLSLESARVKWLAKPMIWVDTREETGHAEVQFEGLKTFHNDAEVDAVIKVLEKIAADKGLVEALSQQEDETPIGVICTYSGQRARLQAAWSRHPWDAKFRSMVRIDTVDAYQGKENSIVVLSLVRSNSYGNPGHVREPNRCNVAVSRAKERLVIVGDSSMWGEKVSEDSPMRSVLEYMRAHPVSSTFVKAGELS